MIPVIIALGMIAYGMSEDKSKKSVKKMAKGGDVDKSLVSEKYRKFVEEFEKEDSYIENLKKNSSNKWQFYVDLDDRKIYNKAKFFLRKQGWLITEEDINKKHFVAVWTSKMAKGGNISKGKKWKQNWKSTNGGSGYDILEIENTKYFSNKYSGGVVVRSKIIESSDPKRVGQFQEDNKKHLTKIFLGEYSFANKMAKGGSVNSFDKIFAEYEDNEDNNYHSENVVLLAKNFGNAEDLKLAKSILKKHESEGSLSNELSNQRRTLHNKLYPKLIASKTKMAKGGNVKNSLKEDDYVWNAVGKKLIVDKVTEDEYYLTTFMQKGSSPFSKKKVDEYIKKGQWTLKPKTKMANGGRLNASKKYNSVSEYVGYAKKGDLVLINRDEKDLEWIGDSHLYRFVGVDKNGEATFKSFGKKGLISFPEKYNVIVVNKKYEKGGKTEVKDLFEYYDEQPISLQKLFAKRKYEPIFNDEYFEDEVLEDLLKDTEKLGYTFEIGADNMPYNLRKK